MTAPVNFFYAPTVSPGRGALRRARQPQPDIAGTAAEILGNDRGVRSCQIRFGVLSGELPTGESAVPAISIIKEQESCQYTAALSTVSDQRLTHGVVRIWRINNGIGETIYRGWPISQHLSNSHSRTVSF